MILIHEIIIRRHHAYKIVFVCNDGRLVQVVVTIVVDNSQLELSCIAFPLSLSRSIREAPAAVAIVSLSSETLGNTIARCNLDLVLRSLKVQSLVGRAHALNSK